jgi:phosphoribosylformylglycinamidine synthase
VKTADFNAVKDMFARAGLGAEFHRLGNLNRAGRLIIAAKGREIYSESGVALQRAWSETTYHMQMLRDNPQCAQQEYDRILDASDPGLHAKLTFDPAQDTAAPYIGRGARPKMAILREQGVNSQIEMAAAFDRAGFETHDVHMSDIIAGRLSLAGFKGVVACGGFSYGDVLGAGEGWAKSILHREQSVARDHTLNGGICCIVLGAMAFIFWATGFWPGLGGLRVAVFLPLAGLWLLGRFWRMPKAAAGR